MKIELILTAEVTDITEQLRGYERMKLLFTQPAYEQYHLLLDGILTQTIPDQSILIKDKTVQISKRHKILSKMIIEVS